MPILIPLVAAAGTAAAGYAAVTAGAYIVGGMMIAGAAMTAIGAISGNSKLTKYGSLLSLAGGLTGLATGAWETAGAEIAKEAAAPAAPAASGVEAAAPVAATGEATGAIAKEGIVATAAEAAPATPPYGGVGTPGAGAGTDAVANVSLPPPAASNWMDTIGSKVTKVGEWMEKNKVATNVGSGILQGAMKGVAEQDAMKERIRQEEEFLARRRAQLNASVTGLKMPSFVPPIK